MQNASPPQSLGKQKIKRLLLEQSLCNFFISVYMEYANGLFFNFPIEDIVKATDVTK